jgi:hypothetical protein
MTWTVDGGLWMGTVDMEVDVDRGPWTVDRALWMWTVDVDMNMDHGHRWWTVNMGCRCGLYM